jgi:WD40 repeat protein
MTRREHHYAIIAGTSSYQQLPPLSHVREDVAKVSGILNEMGYAEVYTGGLLDPADADQLKRQIGTWVRQERRHEDTLVVYYSGHGDRDDQARHYLMCANSEPSGLAETALATEDLVRIVTNGGVRRLLLILDACQAGLGSIEAIRLAAKRLSTEFATAPGAPSDRLVAFSVIAATRPREDAEDGVFAAALDVAINDNALGGSRQKYLFIQQVVDRINEEFAKNGLLQHATSATLCHELDRGFLFNPRYIPDLPSRRLDMAEAQTWNTAHARRRRAEKLIHFGPRGRGTETSMDAGHYFTGRTAILTRLAGWLRGQSEADVRVMLVTGSAGTGKSAVIGRLVTLADEGWRHTIPDSSVPISTDVPLHAIDVAIHARRLHMTDIIGGIADAVGIDANTELELIEELSRHQRPLTIAIDALDEAGGVWDVSHVERIACFLTELARKVRTIKILIGARPHLREFFDDTAAIIDLDEDQWISYHDLSKYAELLLLQPHGIGSTSAYDERSAHKIGTVISERSFPNYLITRLTARALAMNDRPLDTSRSGWESAILSPTTLPQGSTDQIGRAFRWALEIHLQEQAAQVRDLLRPLAYAEGDGLPAYGIWSAIASSLSGRDVIDKDISEVLTIAAPYLVESLDEHERSVYRLYHQGLADDLRRDAPTDASKRIVKALVSIVASGEHGRDWVKADPYTISHLAAHAAAAGQLDHLVLDSEYLVHADPPGLMEHMRDLHTSAAQRIAEVYRTSAHLYTGLDVSERRQLLLVDSARHGNKQLMASVGAVLRRTGHDWIPLWASGSQISASLMTTIASHDRQVHALAYTKLRDRPVAVSGDREGVIVVSDLINGRPLRKIASNFLGGICALCCTRVGDKSVVVAGSWLGSIGLWNVETGAKLAGALPVGNPAGSVLSSILSLSAARLNGRPIVVSGGADGMIRLWSLRGPGGEIRISELNDPIVGSKPGIMAGYGVMLGGIPAVLCIRTATRTVVVGADAHGSIRIWDLATREKLLEISAARPAGLSNAIRALAHFRLNGLDIVTTGGDEGIIDFWDLATGEEVLRSIPSHASKMFEGILGLACYRMDGHVGVVACGGSGVIRAWDAIQGVEIGEPMAGHFRAVRAVCAGTRNGKKIIVTAGDDHLLRVWKVRPRSRPSRFAGHTGVVHQATRTLEGESSVVGTLAYDGRVLLRRLRDGSPIGVLSHGGGDIDAVTFASISDRHIAVTGSSDASIRVWDIKNCEQIGSPLFVSGHDGRDSELSTVLSICVTHVDERFVIVTGGIDGTIRLWDPEGGVQIGHSLVGHDGFVTGLTVARSRKGQVIAISVGMDGTAQLWDLKRQRKIGRFMKPCNPSISAVCCVVHEDTPYILMGGSLGILEMWDLAERKLVGASQMHNEKITSIISVPHFDSSRGWTEGRYIATGGVDGYVNIVAPWSGKVELLSFPAAVGSLVAAPGGRILVCFGWDVALLSTHSRERELRLLDVILGKKRR